MSKEVEKSMEILEKAFKDDSEYAWTWHCNLTMTILDSGVDIEKAKKASTRILREFFNFDIISLKGRSND